MMTSSKDDIVDVVGKFIVDIKSMPEDVKKNIIKKYVEDSLEGQLEEYDGEKVKKIINDTSDQILRMDNEDIEAIIRFYHKKMKDER